MKKLNEKVKVRLPVGIQISLNFFKENKVKTNQGSLS